MMFTARVTCVCESPNTISFRRAPSTARAECTNCGSMLIYKITKGKHRGHFSYKVGKLFPSDLLIETLQAVEREAAEAVVQAASNPTEEVPPLDPETEKIAEEFMKENEDLMRSLAEQEQAEAEAQRQEDIQEEEK